MVNGTGEQTGLRSAFCHQFLIERPVISEVSRFNIGTLEYHPSSAMIFLLKLVFGHMIANPSNYAILKAFQGCEGQRKLYALSTIHLLSLGGKSLWPLLLQSCRWRTLSYLLLKKKKTCKQDICIEHFVQDPRKHTTEDDHRHFLHQDTYIT